MKKISVLSLTMALICVASVTLAQGYKLPAAFTFDREVVQNFYTKQGSREVSVYYTTSGQYACAKRQNSGEGFVIYTKEGMQVAFDVNRKTIMILNSKLMMKNMSGMANDMKKSNPPSTSKAEDLQFTAAKTGKTKSINGYTATEYHMTSKKGSADCWFAKVDFNAQLFLYATGMTSFLDPEMMGGDPKVIANNPIYREITDKNMLMVEVAPDNKKLFDTKSISKSTYTVSTSGYAVKDYSNMTTEDMMKAEQKGKAGQ